MASSDPQLHAMVVAAATQDPSIEIEPGEQILRGCLEILEGDPHVDAAEIARRYVAQVPDADASWVAHLARAATRARPRVP